MNRRQRIQSLSLAAAAAPGPARAAGRSRPSTSTRTLMRWKDYKKVCDFYVDVLGMKVTADDGKQCRLVFGNNAC
jgi:hypothetical protein